MARSPGIGSVGSGWLRPSDNNGITYQPSELTRSELFLEMLHTLNSGYVELLDHPGSSPSWPD